MMCGCGSHHSDFGGLIINHHKLTYTILLLAVILSLVSSMWICEQPTRVNGFSSHQVPEAVFPNLINTFDQQKVVAPDGAEKDGFGYSVAISDDGSTALVGTYYIEFGITHPIGPGSVYAFIKEGDAWIFQQKLPTPPMPDGDLFGYSVALSADGSTGLVGAQGDTGLPETHVPGAAFVFTRSNVTWSQQAVLTASDRAIGDHFGISVSLSDSGNTALIGAYVDDVGTNANQGSAYVYERSGAAWSEQAHLTTTDGAAEDYFGRSVSLSSDGNTALIGANMKMIGGNGNQGAAYIFTRTNTTWSQQSQLIAVDGAAYDWLGGSVAISADGNTALAGAQGHTVGSHMYQGAVFVFVHSGSTWNQQAMLSAPEGEVDLWGDSVALSSDGSTALIEDGYTFRRSGTVWAPSTRLLPEDDASGFGSSVALSEDGTIALIGANSADIGGNQSQGAVYFFTGSYEPPILIFLPVIFR